MHRELMIFRYFDVWFVNYIHNLFNKWMLRLLLENIHQQHLSIYLNKGFTYYLVLTGLLCVCSQIR